MKISHLSIVLIALLSLGACKKKKINTLKSEFKETYAKIVHANYEDAYNEAVVLKAAIDNFVASPTADGLQNAKNAWLAAREAARKIASTFS